MTNPERLCTVLHMTTSPLEQPAYGRRVRQLREEQNLRIGELAEQARISRGYLNNIELGYDDKPSRQVQIAFATALDAPELRPDDAYPTPPPKQPKKPAGPTRRQEKEKEKTSPKRVDDQAVA